MCFRDKPFSVSALEYIKECDLFQSRSQTNKYKIPTPGGRPLHAVFLVVNSDSRFLRHMSDERLLGLGGLISDHALRGSSVAADHLLSLSAECLVLQL